MRNRIIVVLATALMVGGKGGIAAAAEGVEVLSAKRGENCNSADSFEVKVRCTATQELDVRICIQRTSGTWDIGSWTLKPREKTSSYTCHSTGKYVVQSRKPGPAKPWPDPEF